jgi:hypothetical protein
LAWSNATIRKLQQLFGHSFYQSYLLTADGACTGVPGLINSFFGPLDGPLDHPQGRWQGQSVCADLSFSKCHLQWSGADMRKITSAVA